MSISNPGPELAGTAGAARLALSHLVGRGRVCRDPRRVDAPALARRHAEVPGGARRSHSAPVAPPPPPVDVTLRRPRSCRSRHPSPHRRLIQRRRRTPQASRRPPSTPVPPAAPTRPRRAPTASAMPRRSRLRAEHDRGPVAGVQQRLATPAELPAARPERTGRGPKRATLRPGTGGSDDGDVRAALVQAFRLRFDLERRRSVAALGTEERAARRTAQARPTASRCRPRTAPAARAVLEPVRRREGGGAAVTLMTLLGILAVFRMLPPDWNRAFRNSTAAWRPSAYAPPIEHPG